MVNCCGDSHLRISRIIWISTVKSSITSTPLPWHGVAVEELWCLLRKPDLSNLNLGWGRDVLQWTCTLTTYWETPTKRLGNPNKEGTRDWGKFENRQWFCRGTRGDWRLTMREYVAKFFGNSIPPKSWSCVSCCLSGQTFLPFGKSSKRKVAFSTFSTFWFGSESQV